MKLLVLDNYDSFTYNLVQYIQDILGEKVAVFRNDAISLDAVDQYDVIVLSPGPGLPSEAGIMPEVIRQYAGKKIILGVCLGHQAIGEAFGGQLENLSHVYHGVTTPVHLVANDPVLFEGIETVFPAGRYHSWVVAKNAPPECLLVTAKDEKGEIMAMRHMEYDIFGVQFHPESVMTPDGKQMLRNFLNYCLKKSGTPALAAEPASI